MPGKRKTKKPNTRPKNADQALKRIKALLRKKPPFRDERLAPDADHNMLLALVRGELREQTARDVYRFVHLFKSWNNAYCDLLVREYRATQGNPASR